MVVSMLRAASDPEVQVQCAVTVGSFGHKVSGDGEVRRCATDPCALRSANGKGEGALR